MHRFIRWAAGAAAATVPLALALPAMAGVNTNAVQTVANGSAGYSFTHSEPFANAGAQLVTTAQAVNVGTLTGGANTGGMGEQLCDPNNGFGGQIGEVSNGPTGPNANTFNVEYAFGTLAGAAVDNCVGNPLLTNFAHLHATTLDNIPVGHVVDVFVSFKNVHVSVRHPGHWTSCHRHGRLIVHCHWHKRFFTRTTQGRLKFQAQDETGGFEIFSSPWIHTAADFNLDEAGFGVQQNTNGLSADTPKTCPDGTAGGSVFVSPCVPLGTNPAYNGTTGPGGTGAHTLLVTFTGAFTNGDGLALPPVSGPPQLGVNTIHEVATTGNGVNANPATAAPNNSFAAGTVALGGNAQYINIGNNVFHFADFVGNVVSGP